MRTYGVTLTFTGYLFIRQLEEAMGTLTPRLGSLLFLQPALGRYGLSLNCKPAYLCGGYSTKTTRTTATTPGTFRVKKLHRSGKATLMGTTRSPGYFTVKLLGREVGRSFVPEPSRALLALSGIAAVFGLSLWRRLFRSS